MDKSKVNHYFTHDKEAKTGSKRRRVSTDDGRVTPIDEARSPPLERRKSPPKIERNLPIRRERLNQAKSERVPSPPRAKFTFTSKNMTDSSRIKEPLHMEDPISDSSSEESDRDTDTPLQRMMRTRPEPDWTMLYRETPQNWHRGGAAETARYQQAIKDAENSMKYAERAYTNILKSMPSGSVDTHSMRHTIRLERAAVDTLMASKEASRQSCLLGRLLRAGDVSPKRMPMVSGSTGLNEVETSKTKDLSTHITASSTAPMITESNTTGLENEDASTESEEENKDLKGDEEAGTEEEL
ncbi:hypothetical protein KCU78_g1266, partial [Aureobasidium melanogenum]